eukprot:CAMPEP_0177434110 /NCGR_PEP_ID=MMETSP0369-20130122/242_1 /TAXON_ID=447022 ORGANISM="Scrippsiella hangoei-like, Strain SHHI-4" /NCGR_SAMPLE_ID=MMETSP0369 /ASSEMBLY_ACC=CAM_ASM_000364 /LENGTH=56 /DNA_ID=CAMNT_0018904979 /DNA_START=204 /DNA_END=371 /DNA_ORIENTATION=+
MTWAIVFYRRGSHGLLGRRTAHGGFLLEGSHRRRTDARSNGERREGGEGEGEGEGR